MTPYLTAAFYKFVALPDFEGLKDPLLTVCHEHRVKGMVLLAGEGINSTIAGPEHGVRAVLAWLRADPRLADLVHKEAWCDKAPFYRMKVKLKREIVTMGVPEANPSLLAGTYVKPEQWNALISDPDVVVIDTRNQYEVDIGTFSGAVDPHIASFSQLPKWVDEASQLHAQAGKKPKVAMFCTGGIRCENSTALLRLRGFEEVYHLEGGILKYLETIPPEQSLWQGACFVFDERVSVGHGLQVGEHGLCRACRRPISEADKLHAQYEEGVSCAQCYDSTTDVQKSGARERIRQWRLAKERGQSWIGEQN